MNARFPWPLTTGIEGVVDRVLGSDDTEEP